MIEKACKQAWMQLSRKPHMDMCMLGDMNQCTLVCNYYIGINSSFQIIKLILWYNLNIPNNEKMQT